MLMHQPLFVGFAECMNMSLLVNQKIAKNDYGLKNAINAFPEKITYSSKEKLLKFRFESLIGAIMDFLTICGPFLYYFVANRTNNIFLLFVLIE